MRQCVGDHSKGNILVGIDFKNLIAHPGKQGTKRQVFGNFGSHDQPVSEAPDRFTELIAVPVGYRATDQNVMLPGVPPQRRLKCSQQRHVEGDPFFPTYLPQFGEETRSQGELARRATSRWRLRSWARAREL